MNLFVSFFLSLSHQWIDFGLNGEKIGSLRAKYEYDCNLTRLLSNFADLAESLHSEEDVFSLVELEQVNSGELEKALERLFNMADHHIIPCSVGSL